MPETLRRFSPFQAKDNLSQAEQRQILSQLLEARQRLRAAENYFQNVCDPDLIEECIYELNAIETRYRYLLRRARGLGVTNETYLKGMDADLIGPEGR